LHRYLAAPVFAFFESRAVARRRTIAKDLSYRKNLPNYFEKVGAGVRRFLSNHWQNLLQQPSAHGFLSGFSTRCQNHPLSTAIYWLRNAGARFSMNAFMPSFWSSVAKVL
ncbi:MAG: hypothetical protein ACRYGK_02325, partial [Janthinobacterium lividum]